MNQKYPGRKHGAHTARGTSNYGTPRELFDSLNNEFKFALDPCADPFRLLCPENYTEDGLQKPWHGAVFMNPPFKDAGLWVEKAYKESLQEECIVVCLLPSRTDTKWFHEIVLPYGKIQWIRKRVRYHNMEHNAPFSSMIVIFGE